ncbi:hypothetical protein Dfer_2363 [Dyadobacter fermentans DSM 18053]|uniref:Molybdenum ABC transporter permease n=1 Tax=Dyadobacter fermentans (strain ATCC 700827 / DSM 18053 / CIP 107007 / KCTC 52180 / NS114) TaxID=471854 RepID=C6W0H5_DYAFD|nr:hypothetical protein Dfer_2363 [Dyadobacter fermentans DSM 18053]
MILAFNITSVMMYGFVLLATGIAIRFVVNRRRFNRRGIGGAQFYDSYWSSVLISTLEGLSMLASAGCIVVGLLLFFIELFNSH